MPLEDFLAPGENIRYRGLGPVVYEGDLYTFFITDRRLIWYKRTGLIFKKENTVAEPIEDVREVVYSETGKMFPNGTMMLENGFITLRTRKRSIEFSGSVKIMQSIHTKMRSQMSHVTFLP